MKTAYLIKAMPSSINFHCDPVRGISFTTSYLDITFLDNVMIGDDLAIIAQQKVYEEPQGVGRPTLWFLIFSDKGFSNSNFEEIWKFANQFGANLYQYTQLGLNLSYRDVWTFPNIPNEWRLAETLVKFNAKGSVEGIYWSDPSQSTYEENGEILRETTMKTIKADLVTVIRSEKMLTQSHFIHMTIPGTATKIDLSPFYQSNDVLEQIKNNGFCRFSEEQNYVLQLFNRAITQEDMFVSYTILFQLIEVLIGLAKSTKIEKNARERLHAFLKTDSDLAQFYDRILGAVGAIKKETSERLLLNGTRLLLGKKLTETLDVSQFPKWRRIRGSLTHPGEAASISQDDFFDCYQSLRKFCASILSELHS